MLIKRPVDLVLLVDACLAPKQLDLVKKVLASFEKNCIRRLKKTVRVSVIQYGQRVKVVKWLNTKTNLDKLRLVASRGNKYRLQKGINYARKYAYRSRFGHRRGARKMLVVVGSAWNLDRTSTIKEAEMARLRTNIEFYYMALAEKRWQVDTSLLKGVAPIRGRYSVTWVYQRWTSKGIVQRICRGVNYQGKK
jgi:hypothetical protein